MYAPTGAKQALSRVKQDDKRQVTCDVVFNEAGGVIACHLITGGKTSAVLPSESVRDERTVYNFTESHWCTLLAKQR